MIALVRTTEPYKIFIKQIRFHKDLFTNIIKIGLPAGLQSVMYGFSNIFVQASVNAFGTDTVAAWTAYGKIDAVFWMMIGAFGVSITTFVGQNFGAGKYDRVHKSTGICLAMAAGSTIVLSTFLCLFGKYIYRIFTQDAIVIDRGIQILLFLVPFWITYVSIEIFSGAIRGTGGSVIPMIMTCFGVCILRIIWVHTGVPYFNTIESVAASYPITWILTSLLFIIYYFRGRWLRRRRAFAGDPLTDGEKMHIFQSFLGRKV